MYTRLLQSRPMKMHNNIIHSTIFFNPWILRNPQVKEFTNYRETRKKILEPESFGLSNDDCRHQKSLDLFNENCFKPLKVLKDGPGSKKIIWLNYFRLETPIEEFKKRNPCKSDVNWSHTPLCWTAAWYLQETLIYYTGGSSERQGKVRSGRIRTGMAIIAARS